VTVERGASRPLEVQVYERVREAILGGRLRPGARLPATRALAGELGVARNVAVAAFEQLRAEGYLEARVGSGTRVSRVLPEDLIRIPSSASPPSNRRGPVRPSVRGARLANARRRLSRYEGPLAPFHLGTPALAEFPVALWTRLQRSRWSRAGVSTLDYGHVQGTRELRRAIAHYAAASRGVRGNPEQVFVVSGSQQALDLACRVLADPGDRAWLEDPGYLGARGAMTASGLRIVPVPVDHAGLDVAQGVRRAPRARLAYVSPSHQFPLGTTLSLERRLALLRWAVRARAFVLEDDYDSEFRFTERPLPALQGLDDAGRVIYVSTFSKMLAPALRLGYLVVPEGLVDAFRAARQFGDGHSPVLDQLVLADFIEGGHFERHVRRMRGLYRERQEALVEAVRRRLQGALEIIPAGGGMHLSGLLARGRSDRNVAARAAAAGIDVIALSDVALRPLARGGLVLGYAAFTPAEIGRGVHRLERVIAQASSSSKEGAA
jgi:GntR family transcriptional regulator/MocR family aminotransferase